MKALPFALVWPRGNGRRKGGEALVRLLALLAQEQLQSFESDERLQAAEQRK